MLLLSYERTGDKRWTLYNDSVAVAEVALNESGKCEISTESTDPYVWAAIRHLAADRERIAARTGRRLPAVA